MIRRIRMIRRKFPTVMVRRRLENCRPLICEIYSRRLENYYRQEREDGPHMRAIKDTVTDLIELDRRDLNKMAKRLRVSHKGTKDKVAKTIALIWEVGKYNNWLCKQQPIMMRRKHAKN
uniref:Uncharacterized protein n=1 Tax=viral metagenome TaxID=1070528 RepID=A0A6M3IM33_9ZZZZ